MFCDFCKSSEVVCGFGSPDTAVLMVNGKKSATWHNTGGWAACEPCAQLLESGKLDELTERALDSEENGLPTKASPEVRMVYFMLLRGQYEKINRKREAA